MQNGSHAMDERRGLLSGTPNVEDLASGRMKAVLMERLRDMRRSKGLTQVEAARWFGVTQPRISHLAQKRANRFTVDTLIDMLAHAGVRLSPTFENVSNEEGGECLRSRSRRVLE
jgi:predicted XRE-type DNA-binding protein